MQSQSRAGPDAHLQQLGRGRQRCGCRLPGTVHRLARPVQTSCTRCSTSRGRQLVLLTGVLLRLLPGGEGGRPRRRPGRRLRVASCCCLVHLGGAQLAGLAEAAGGHLSWTDNACSRSGTQELDDCEQGMGSSGTACSDKVPFLAWELAASESSACKALSAAPGAQKLAERMGWKHQDQQQE